MKTHFYTILITLFCLLHFNCLLSQESFLKSKVDEKIELLGIIYRLAEAQEYSQGVIKSYNDDTDNYFANFKNHNAVLLAKEYRQNGIGYDAVMSLAINLDIQNSSIDLNDNIYNNLDKRWNKEMLDRFTEKISDFYKETDFRKFFEAHCGIYSQAEQAMNEILESKMDFSWFNSFFGVKGGNYNIFISLTNGPSNYGMKITHKNEGDDLCPIIGAGSMNGNPAFSSEGAVRLLVHEISHPYCNPIVDSYKEELTKSGKTIFPHISQKMENQAYNNWNIVMYEALVRASTICYVNQDTLTKLKVKDMIDYETNCGFFWMADLFKFLNTKYEANRNEYPDLKSFMPQIISFYDILATKIEGRSELFSKIIYSSIDNNSKVPNTTQELIFKFSKPMDIKRGYGFGYGKGGKDFFPKTEKIEWIDDKTIKLTLNLEQTKKYSIQLYIPAYKDTEGFPVMESYHLEFETE